MQADGAARGCARGISRAGRSGLAAVPAERGDEVVLDGVTRRNRHGQHPAPLGPLSLTVRAGHRAALMGGPGSGKSGILRLIAGLDVPDEGNVTVGGVRVDRLSAAGRARHRARLGWLSQDDVLWDNHTAVDNVIIPVLPYHTRFKPRQRARELLAGLGLADPRDCDRRPVGGLTAAQRQRVLLARAVISDPAVLLVDEPARGLDEQGVAEVLNSLIALHREHRMTLLVASDQLTVAARFHPVVMLSDGRIDSEHADASDPRTVLEWVKRPAPPA